MRCNFFAVSALCACLRDLWLSDPSSALHQSLFLSLFALSSSLSIPDLKHIHIHTESVDPHSTVSMVVCKIVVGIRMLDGIDARNKSRKKPSGFFHFRKDAVPLSLDNARCVSVLLAFVSSITVACVSNMENIGAG